MGNDVKETILEFPRKIFLHMWKRNRYFSPWPTQPLHPMAPTYLSNLILYLLPHFLLCSNKFVFFFVFQALHLVSTLGPLLALFFLIGLPKSWCSWVLLIIQVSGEMCLLSLSLDHPI